MADLDKLPEYLRERGFTRVLGVKGWRKRKRPASTGGWDPRGIVVHHTGGKPNGMKYAETVLAQGYSGLPGPLCQIALNRAGTVIFIANGRSNHAGKVRKVGFMNAGDGNSQSLGIEAMNTGSEGWTDKQYTAYVRLCAAICDFMGWPRSRVLGHGEVSTSGKWDPGIRPGVMMDMDKFRADVAAVTFDADKPEPAPEPAPIGPVDKRWFKFAFVNHAAAAGALAKVGAMARWLSRRRRLFDEVASINADVIGGLECGGGATWRHVQKAYMNRGYELAHHVKGRAIWVRRGVRVVAKGYFDPPALGPEKTYWKPAPWIIAEFDGTLGMIVVSHLETSRKGDQLRVDQQTLIIKSAENVAKQHGLDKSRILFLSDTASDNWVRERAFNALGYGDVLETAAKIVNAEYKSYNEFKAPIKGPRVDIAAVRYDPKKLKGADGNRPVRVASQRLTKLTDHHIIAGVIERQ